MATPSADPLTSLRRSIASDNPPIATSSSEPPENANGTDDLAIATHLHFPGSDAQTFSLDTPTRFISSDQPVDLRSIYFAWQKKDVAIPDYIAATQQLNEELAGKSRVQNLVFVERLDLITWLEGASEESEYIKVSDADSAARSAHVASGAAGGVSTIPSSAAGARIGKSIDPRLQIIYDGERRMGDRNSVLRGIKPTVSHPLANHHSFTTLRFSPRTSRIFVKPPNYSSPALVPLLPQQALVPLQPPPLRQPTLRWSTSLKSPPVAQTLSSYFHLLHHLFCACRISSLSFTTEHTFRQTALLPAPLAPQPIFCTSLAYFPLLIPTAHCDSY